MSLNYRRNNLQDTSGNALATHDVYVYPVGTTVTTTANGTRTPAVRAGHSIKANDKVLIDPTGDAYYRTVTSVTQTQLTLDSGGDTVDVVAGDVIINLQADTGATSPNYDGATIPIYDEQSGASTAISNSMVTSGSDGEYEYFYNGDGMAWELVLNTSGTPVEVIKGFSAVTGRLNIVDYGATGDGSTNDTTEIQACIEACGAAEKYECFVPTGDFQVSTIELIDGVILRGIQPGGFASATNDWASKLSQVAGTNDSMIIFEGHLTSGNYWADYTGVENLALLGDTTATAGSAIHFKDADGNLVILQDYVFLNNLLIRGWKDNGIFMPKGGTPFKVQNIVAIFNDEYAIKVVGANFSLFAAQFDNISMDANTAGGIYIESANEYSNLIFTHIKSEKRTNTSYSNATGNDTAITLHNCDRVPVSIHGLGSISTVVDAGAGSGFEAPGAVVKITGTGVPNIHWSGVGVRLRNGDSGTPYIINDTVENRTVGINVKEGTYSVQHVVWSSIDPDSIADGAGSTKNVTMQGTNSVALGDPVLCSFAADTQGIILGQAYVSAADVVAWRLQNETGGAIDLGEANQKVLLMPNEMFKVITTATWNPALVADGAQTTVTMEVPEAEFGDFTMFTHAANLKSMIGQAYVNAAPGDDDILTWDESVVCYEDNILKYPTVATIEVVLQNESGDAQDVDSATLTTYILKDKAFKWINSKRWGPGELADGDAETTTITVTGAALGDFVLGTFSKDLQGALLTAWVSAANTVSVRIQNETGATITLGEDILKVGIIDVHRQSW